MSNILSPIVARYSFFFTIAMFSSSKISQSKQPTLLVQTLLLDAQQRYQDKAMQTLRALIRNASASSSLSQSSASRSAGNSTDISSTSSCTAQSFTELPSTRSIPPYDNKARSSSPQQQRSYEPLEATFVSTALHGQSSPSSAPPASSARSNAAAADMHTGVASSDRLHAQLMRHKIQSSKVSKNAFATLLSLTFTMILLSLLQSKKRLLRRKGRSPRGTVRRRSRRCQQDRDIHAHAHSHFHSQSHSYPQSRPLSRSPSRSPHTNTNTLTRTLMDGMTEGAHSLTQSPPPSYKHHYIDANHAEYEPTQLRQSRSLQAIVHERPVSPTRAPATRSFGSEHCSSAINQYSLQNAAWSLSDGDLPSIRSKKDLVVAWLDQQNTTTMTDINGHQLWGKSNDYLDQMEKQHVYQTQPSPFGFQTKLESYHNEQSITDCDAQPEPRQVRYRACQISNDQYPSSAHQSLSPSSHRHQHQSSHPPHFYTGDPSHHQFSHPHQSYQHYLYEQNHARSIELHNSIDHHHMYYTHHHYGDNLSHANQEHQRSFSLMHAEETSNRLQTDSPPPTAPRFEDLSPAEQVRQEHYWRRQRHQIHNQQMQLRRQQQHYHQQSIYAQHWHHSHQYHHKFVTHSRPYHFNQERQVTSLFIPSAHELDWYPSSHRATKAPSAQDLAWERHCYYQQLQLHEEAIAEQKWTDVHRQRLQQQQQQGRLSVPEQDLVSRTSSLSRITSSSLSPQAAQALGLSRSKSTSTFEPWRENTVQKHQKVRQPSSGESGYPKSIIVDCPILSAGRRLIKRNGIKATSDIGQQSSATTSEALDPTSDSPQPSTPLQRPEIPLSRKKTLKDLAPSIRSLARRCSSRFSSRPSSFAGSSSDLVLKYSEEKLTIGSLNLKASHMSLPASGNTAQLLTSGPDGAVDLEMVPQSEASTTIPITCDYTPSMSTPSLPLGTVPERIPIHRKVALFRSKTTTHSRARDTSPNCNISETKTSNTDTSSTRSRSLTSPQRRSLRLANGHGLDLTMSSPNTTTTADSTIVSSASQDIEKSASELDKALFIDAHCAEEDPQKAARRQVAALLAMGRKDRVSAKTGQVITRSTPPPSETHLTPLAVESQQDMPLDSSTSEQKLFVKEDPCEHIAFMLVPKSRYEFQPLVVM